MLSLSPAAIMPATTLLIDKLLLKIQQALSAKSFADAMETLNTLLNVYGSELSSSQWANLLPLLADAKTEHTVFNYLHSQKQSQEVDKICKEKVEPYLVQLPVARQAEFYQILADLYFQHRHFVAAARYYNTHRRLSPLLEVKEAEAKEITGGIGAGAETAALLEQLLRLQAPTTLAIFIVQFQRLSQLLDRLIELKQLSIVDHFYQQLAPWLESALTSWDNALVKARNQGGQSEQAFAAAWQQLAPSIEQWAHHHQWGWVQRASKILMADGKHKKWLSADIKTWLGQLELHELPMSLASSQSLLRTTDFRQLLQTYRSQLIIALNAGDFISGQSTYTQQIEALLQSLMAEGEALLGPAPCGFCVVAKGSLARGDLTLASDVDLFILLADGSQREAPYFQVLKEILRIRLLCLDSEGCLILDPGEGELLGDAQQLIERRKDPKRWQAGAESMDVSQLDPYARCFGRELYANAQGKGLFLAYQQHLQAYLQIGGGTVLSPLMKEQKTISPGDEKGGVTCKDPPLHQSVARDFLQKKHYKNLRKASETKPGSLSPLNLKERYLAPLMYVCADLALYEGLKNQEGVLLSAVPEIIPALQKKGFLAPLFAEELQQAWEFLQRLRIQQQAAWFNYRGQCAVEQDVMYPLAWEQKDLPVELRLTPEAEKNLRHLDRFVLQPLYTALLTWLNEPIKNPLDPVIYLAKKTIFAPIAKSQEIETALQEVITLLSYRCAPAAVHLSFYQGLPDPLKKNYYTRVRDTLQRQAEATPVHLANLVMAYAQMPALDEWLLPLWQNRQDTAAAENLLQTLGRYPFRDGTRPYYQESLQAWQQTLELLTDPLPPKAQQDWSQIPASWVVQWVTAQGSPVTRLLKKTILEDWQHQGYLNAKFELLPKIQWKKSTDGRGQVLPITQDEKIIAYAKCYPEMPGVQRLAESLAWRVSGYGPLSTLAKCTHTTTGAYSPILFSQAAGETLQSVLRTGNLEAIEARLDPYNFTLKVIETLLLLYEDDKLDNLAAFLLSNPARADTYRLVSFDCDRVLVEPLLKRQSGLKTEIKVNVKSVVFCLQAMQKPLEKAALQAFQALDPLTLLSQWLSEQAKLDVLYTPATPLSSKTTLFAIPELLALAENKPQATFVQAALSDQAVKKLYYRWRRLHTVLSSKTPPRTPFELLAAMEPALASYYQVVWEQHNNVSARFNALPTDYVVIEEKQPVSPLSMPVSSAPLPIRSPSSLHYHQTTGHARERMLKTLTLPKVTDIKSLKEAIVKGCFRTPALALELELEPTHKAWGRVAILRTQLQQGNLTAFTELKAEDYLREQILQGLDWQRMQSSPQTIEQSQSNLLKALIGGRYYRLDFSHCEALTNDRLLDILKTCPELRELRLSHCIQLTTDLLPKLARVCPYLEKLDLRGLVKLTLMTQLNFIGNPNGSLAFLHLRRLWLDGCEVLTQVDITAARLETLTIQDCKALSLLNIRELPEPFALTWEPVTVLAEMQKNLKEVGEPDLRGLQYCLNEQAHLLPFLRATSARENQPLTRYVWVEDILQRWLRRGIEALRQSGNLFRSRIELECAFRQALSDMAIPASEHKAVRSTVSTTALFPVEAARLLTPLEGSGRQFAFFHSLLRNYVIAADWLETLLRPGAFLPSHLKWSWLGEQRFVEVLIEEIASSTHLQTQLLKNILRSRTEAQAAPLAAVSISLLNAAGVCLAEQDFRGVRIPYADLQGAFLGHTLFTGADLTGVCLQNAYLSGADLRQARLAHISFSSPSKKDSPRRPQTSSGHTGGVLSVAFSPDGSWLVSGSWDHTVRLWSVSSRRHHHTFSGHTGGVKSVAFSPGGAWLALGSRDHTVRLWSVSSRRLQHTFSEREAILSLTFSPDGGFLASGSGDGTIRLRAVPSCRVQHIFSEYKRPVNSIAFSPDGLLLVSGSGDNTIRFWAMSSRQLQSQSTFPEHGNGITSVAFSPDGSVLASGSGDGTIRLRAVSSGLGPLHTTFSGHMSRVTSVAFSPDGSLLASSGDDRTVRLWAVTAGSCLHVMRDVVSPINSVAWKPVKTGLYLATGSDDSAVRYWRVTRMGEELQVALLWSSHPIEKFSCQDVLITGAQGLDADTYQFLKQHGAIGEPAKVEAGEIKSSQVEADTRSTLGDAKSAVGGSEAKETKSVVSSSIVAHWPSHTPRQPSLFFAAVPREEEAVTPAAAFFSVEENEIAPSDEKAPGDEKAVDRVRPGAPSQKRASDGPKP